MTIVMDEEAFSSSITSLSSSGNFHQTTLIEPATMTNASSYMVASSSSSSSASLNNSVNPINSSSSSPATAANGNTTTSIRFNKKKFAFTLFDKCVICLILWAFYTTNTHNNKKCKLKKSFENFRNEKLMFLKLNFNKAKFKPKQRKFFFVSKTRILRTQIKISVKILKWSNWSEILSKISWISWVFIYSHFYYIKFLEIKQLP